MGARTATPPVRRSLSGNERDLAREPPRFNLSLAVVAGVPTLGLWSLARRVMQVPALVLQALNRVSFPTMSHLVAAKENPAPLIERAVAMVVVGTGIILTGLAGSAPGLIPGVFGEQWRDASLIIPGGVPGSRHKRLCFRCSQGYLYALGDASAVLRYAILETIALFAVTLPLVAVLGVPGIGLGLALASMVGAYVLRQSMLRWAKVDPVRPLLVPVAVGIVAAAIGWVITDYWGADLLAGLMGGTCAVVIFVALLSVLRRKLVGETFRFAVSSMRAVRSASTHAA